MRTLYFVLGLCLSFGLAPSLPAQEAPLETAPITVASGPTDAQIETRLTDILSQLSDTNTVFVSVQSSVVTLSGEAANTEAAERAVNIAGRMDGVVAVQDNIIRTLDVADNVTPLVSRTAELSTQFLRALPLIAAAVVLLATRPSGTASAYVSTASAVATFVLSLIEGRSAAAPIKPPPKSLVASTSGWDRQECVRQPCDESRPTGGKERSQSERNVP